MTRPHTSAPARPVPSRLRELFLVMATTLVLGSGTVRAASPTPFVPTDFTPPAALEADGYRLRMLTVNDVVKDYDAVMSSAEHIQQDVWPGSQWPTGLSLEQNLVDLGWHQKEFQRGTSFAYTVVEADESRVIGCIYIYATRKTDYDAEVYLWTRPPEQLAWLDEDRLRETVRAWLAAQWPFERPVFPGSDVSWSDFESLPEAPR